MTKKQENPWASGPAEIMKHGFELLSKDTDASRRIAMILIDNAVEQMMKAYLSLPKRVLGFSISRKKRSEAFENFPSLLDAFEEHAASKLDGIDLGVIEWYHNLRNELYHQGFGLTVEQEKVEIYGELARILFQNLFGETLPDIRDSKATMLGRFLESWNRLDKALITLARNYGLDRNFAATLHSTRYLRDVGGIENQAYYEVEELRKLRNEIVHNQTDFNKVLTERIVARISELADFYKDVLSE